MAVNTCYWPLYEIENGVTKITSTPKEKIAVAEFMKPQGRFKHLFEPGNEALLQRVQDEVDAEWEKLKNAEKCGC
jgi:pyruvate ferredoxin oxidoreductase beta subunit